MGRATFSEITRTQTLLDEKGYELWVAPLLEVILLGIDIGGKSVDSLSEYRKSHSKIPV